MNKRLLSYQLTPHALLASFASAPDGVADARTPVHVVHAFARPLPHLDAGPLVLVSVREFDPHAPCPEDGLYTYLVAANGLFVWSRRAGLDALIPVCGWQVPELAPAVPRVLLDARVRHSALWSMREQARTPDGERFREMLFHGVRNAAGALHWQAPPQKRGPYAVEPLAHDDGDVIADLHTHPAGARGFSQTDLRDADGLRLHLMLEGVDATACTVHAAVSVFGHCFEFPATWVCAGLYEGEHGPQL